MKNQIISAVGSIPGLKEKLDQYPILAKKLEAFASDFGKTILTLEYEGLTFRVKPVSQTTIEEVLESGHYTSRYDYLKNEVNAKIFRDRPVDLPEEEVILDILPKGEVLSKGGVEAYWDEKGLELVPHADAYLDQLMRDITEDQMPLELKCKHIVAYTKEPNFRSGNGSAGHLYVNRYVVGDRDLGMAVESDVSSDRWAFVLRKKKLKTKS